MTTDVPHLRRRARRLGALATTLAVAGALSLVGAPAQAADPAADYQAVAQTSFSTSGDCTLTNTGASSTAMQTIASTGTKKIALSKSSTATATNTDPMKPTDTASYAAKASLAGTVVGKSGAFVSLSLKGSMSASTSAKQGLQTDCEPEVSANVGVQVALRVAKTGWLKLSSSSGKGVFQILTLSGSGSGGVQMVSFGTKSSNVVKRKVPAGTYTLLVQSQLVDFTDLSGSGLPYSASAATSLGVVYSAKKP